MDTRAAITILTYVIGVIKTYKLTYEAASVMHALFDRASSSNRWNIKALFLRENLDYFSPKVEQLDIFRDGEKMTFLSFTEKIVTAKNGKFPLHFIPTCVAD
jgi:cell cycle checkpoint control protein RAD9A